MVLKQAFNYKHSGIKKEIKDPHPKVVEAIERVKETKEQELIDLDTSCVVRVLFNEKADKIQVMYYLPSATYQEA